MAIKNRLYNFRVLNGSNNEKSQNTQTAHLDRLGFTNDTNSLDSRLLPANNRVAVFAWVVSRCTLGIRPYIDDYAYTIIICVICFIGDMACMDNHSIFSEQTTFW